MRIKIKAAKKKQLARRWTAVGALVAYSACSGGVDAYAQQAPLEPWRKSPSSQGNLPVRRYDIAAGLLENVIPAFEAAAGLEIQAPNAAILSVPSPGVAGSYTVEQGLHKLLNGTGIDYRFSSPGKVVLQISKVVTSVEVTASVDALAESSAKYSQPITDTPQTINEVPRQVLDQQGVSTLRDALRNVAGISLAAGEGGAQGDNLTIRGFSARNDLFIDGMRDFGSYYRDPFNVQEVEVLQGPSSVTFGRGSTGGVVNQSSKTPGMDPSISAGMQFGTDLTRRVMLDINEPLPKLASGAAFRLNLMGNLNDVSERDVAENRRFGIAPSLSLGLGTPTRWMFSYFHQTADDIPDYGLPWLFNGPAPVNRTNYYGFADGNYLRTYDDIGTAKVEHDFNSNLSLRNQVRYANYVRDVLITEPQVATPVTLATPLSAITVNRHEIGVNSVETYLDDQLDLTANVRTGFLRHSFAAGIESGRETSDPTRPTWTNVPTTSLLDPDPDQALASTQTITSRVTTNSITAAAYVLDTMHLGSQWDLTGGIRWDRFATDYKQSVAPASAFHRVDEMPSWRAALVYKPLAFGSVYFDAGTSFNPSAESLSLNAATANLPPEKNKTYEFGSKWDLPQNRLSLRAGVFRTEKDNAREPAPDNPLLDVLAGNQRVNGAEVEVRGRILSRWEMLASYANLDGKVVSSQYYPAAIGATLANVPRNTFNIWNDVRLPWRFEGGMGANYVSSRTASSTAPFDPITGLVKQVPGYWVFNAMLKRRINEHVDLQVNAYNLADRYYYDELHPAHIVLGPGRSALVGINFKF
jgi:catecholate siderophore receptor